MPSAPPPFFFLAECLEYRAGVGSLDYQSAPYYLITVACEDGFETAATEVIQVNISPSSPPIFDPDVHFSKCSLSAIVKAFQ